MSRNTHSNTHPITTPSSETLRRLEAIVREQGFEHFGFAVLARPFSMDLYEEWINRGFHGEMEYLARHLPDKRDPERLLSRARSAIVVTKNYVPHPEPLETWPLSGASRVAAYAQGRDYHHFLGGQLKKICDTLKAEFPNDEFRSFTDSAPVLERDLAARAGLGWIGKNTCLIDRKEGSLFFLGEIYTTLQLPVAQLNSEDLTRDFCGTCSRCIEVCPTEAIIAPREMDARKCISYLTIESRQIPPEPLREKIGDWLFGCDLCQTVCPWNLKVHGKNFFDKERQRRAGDSTRLDLIEDLRYLLTAPNRRIERDFAGTPLARAGGFGLKRNALIVAANLKLSELRAEINQLVGHPKLDELALWSLNQIEFDDNKN